MNRVFSITKSFVFAILVVAAAFAGAAAQTVKYSSRVLLIPLDDRPPCLQMPVKMGLIGDVEVVAPPRELLGRFTEFGKSDEIISWIRKQNLKSFDAAIVSLDMLAYGGLVAMREYETDTATAKKRADIVRHIRKSAPKMPIYGSSVIMRLAPTGNVVNESYRNNLSKWAEISVDKSKKVETAELEKKIPAEALDKYKKARERDLQINLYSVDLVREKVIDYLILSQDDAKPNGVHIADREKLIDYVAKNNLGERVAIQPGADEVSMLLLARSVTDKYKYRPKIKAIYSDEKIADQIMPYEDRPLRKTVSFHIKAVGATEVQEESAADVLFYVFVSRFENGKAKSFASRIKSNFVENDGNPNRKAKQAIVADIDIKGEIQGGDVAFSDEVQNSQILSKLAGYASWNTAGNTIGTALPQGVLFATMSNRLGISADPKHNFKLLRTSRNLMIRTTYAQTWFTLNRFLDDYVYHTIVRPKSIAFSKDNGWNSFRLTLEQTKAVEEYAEPLIRKEIRNALNRISPLYWAYLSDLVCEDVRKFNFELPWGRTFEAEIDFELHCKAPFELKF